MARKYIMPQGQIARAGNSNTTMTQRKYLRLSLEDLERLYEESLTNILALCDLRNELQHRNTNRAKSLAIKVGKKIASLSDKSPEGSQMHTPNTFATKESGLSPLSDNHNQTQSSIPQNTVTPNDRQPKSILPSVPVSILDAWIATEILSPQPLPEARDMAAIGRTLVRLDQISEPWRERKFWRQGNERAVYWMIYLGELDLSKAMKAIVSRYPDQSINDRSEVNGNTTLAVIVVDSFGKLVQGKVFVSSFAWGYGKVLGGKLTDLSEFEVSERELVKELEKQLIIQDSDGKILPVNAACISNAIDRLVVSLRLPNNEIAKPGIAIRVAQWGSFNDPPEPELLNSFYIGDLARARSALRSGQVGSSLSSYLNGKAKRERRDALQDRTVLSELVAPSRTPLSRWPSPGHYPLVLMQQAAVNHAVTDLADRGLVAINGPPGTGKTTLLRDIVAKVTLDQAMAMSKFDKPVQAFSHITSMKTGQAFTHLYQLDSSLLGNEIVVASSNNKAVENISREIPSSEAIAADLVPPARYFQSIADSVAAGKDNITDGSTWGLAAAVLGNSANKNAFTQSFYWHEKRGMARYLKAILNDVDIVDDGVTDIDDQSVLSTIDVSVIEQPPHGEMEAQERWCIARAQFLNKLKSVESLQKKAQAGYEAVNKLKLISAKRGKLVNLLHDAVLRCEKAEADTATASREMESAVAMHGAATRSISAIKELRPGWFSRLFRTLEYRNWRIQLSNSQMSLSMADGSLQRSAEFVKSANRILAKTQSEIAVTQREIGQADAQIAALRSVIDDLQNNHKCTIADESFWSQDERILHVQSPWCFPELKKASNDLFVESFALRRAFIDAAAKPLRHNLRAALELLKGRSLKEQQESARQSLWSSLFLVVPVISTTFASTARLFGKLGSEQLGWLLIDEAGQAVPQAAVGLIMRSKRTIVIGDPQQIPPVVTTPPTLISSIFSAFSVNTEEWAAPEASAQTLADRSSWFGTTIHTNDGDMWVGSPLRVHRRCDNPMFKISNYIAYNNMMVHGTPPGPTGIGKVLGDSTWINVSGDATDKWCDAEGECAINLLRKIQYGNITDPDIFFITPFKIVADKLREAIRNDRGISNWLPNGARNWTNERVGTIHTFQGKEAEAVIIVLGAPTNESRGARRWAGGQPNLLNVAVTRAKRRLYVIGDRNAWKDAGVFACLHQTIRPTNEGPKDPGLQ